MSDGEVRQYRFGQFEADFRLGELRKSGLRLRLGAQPLQILECLLERPGDVVSREDLRARLWPADTFVDFEHNLNSAVKRLRSALGDSADSPRFIETLPRRGYRFLAPVEVRAATAPPNRTQDVTATGTEGFAARDDFGGWSPSAPGLPRARNRWPHSWRPAVVGLVLVSMVAVMWLVSRVGTQEGASGDFVTSIAVLPFENLSGDDTQSYLADGTTEALIAGLAQIRSIKVISRTSVMRFRGAHRPVRDIARELGVSTVLEGSVTRLGDELRITAQLIDAGTDRHVWAESYNGRVSDLLTFQSRVAQAVAREVHATLSPPEAARLAVIPSVDPQVHEAYLKARYFWNQRTPEGLARAIDSYNQALDLDPGHAPSEAGLADVYNLLPRYTYVPTRTALLDAKQHALAALALDPQLAEAHAALAKVQHSLDWDWERAEASFRRAIATSPGYATAHHWYSVLLLTLGRVQEGVEEARQARDLDPLSPVINLHLAYSLSYAGRLDEAQAGIARALELEPRYANAHYLRGWILLRRGDFGGARDAFTTAIDLTSSPREYAGGLVAADVASGRLDEARRLVVDLEAVQTSAEDSGQPLFWALVALDRTDEALRILERDFENRSVAFYLFDLTNHWFLEPLRAAPRLRALYERAGLDVLRRTSPVASPPRQTRGD